VIDLNGKSQYETLVHKLSGDVSILINILNGLTVP